MKETQKEEVRTAVTETVAAGVSQKEESEISTASSSRQEAKPASRTPVEPKPDQEPPAPKKHRDNQPVKLHTARPIEPAKKSTESASVSGEDKTHHLLEEVLVRLKSHSRTELYDDFSMFKLLATMAQVIALACVVVSLIFWLSPKYDNGFVQNMIGYAVVIQLVVIALLLMHKRD